MTSRERVKYVLNHKTPDYIPNGLGGCETTGVHAVAYNHLQEALGLDLQPPRVDTFMFNAVFEIPLINKMCGDIILMASPRMCYSPLHYYDVDTWKRQKLWGKDFRVAAAEFFTECPDGSVIWETRGKNICPKGTYYFDSPIPTDMSSELYIPDPDKIILKDVLNDDMLLRLERVAERLYNETDLSICLGETITDLQAAPGGYINSMLLMLEEPDVMKAILKKSVEAGLKQLELLDQAVGKYVDILSIAHDFGDNRGITIGAPLWREIYKPFYKELFQGWHNRTNMKINLHSCGSITEILDDLIECGMDMVNPIQTSAAGMSPHSLKGNFGNRVILYGGAYDAQLINASASYDEVYHAVYDNIKTLGKGGNYIFSGVHNLPPNVPSHHFAAMLDAYYDARYY